MKTKYILTASITLTLIFTNNIKGQDLYQDELETVYLTKSDKEIVYTNDFLVYNDILINQEELKFAKEIKKAKSKNNTLLFLSHLSNLELAEDEYLKIIRRSANRSKTSEEFEKFLKEEIPELKNQIQGDKILNYLYIISRRNTFNGKIDALPSVL